MPAPNDLTVKESASWRHHFLAAATAPDRLPWDDPTVLRQEESRSIQSSIQQFQLGEGSSGRRLLQRGRELANATGDSDFLEALMLFVKEEQRHSGYLLRFMQREGIPASSSHWVDTVFRRLRVLAGLELSLRVLVTAEIIAIPYYRALGAATRSPLLQAICERILQDEAAHLRFQASMLSRISSARSFFGDRIVAAMHRAFLSVTCYVVWREHGRVFRAAGYSRGGFLTEAFWEFDRLDNAVGRGPVRACIPEAHRDEENQGEHSGHESSQERTEGLMVKNRN
jgi:hypothetical protein